MPQLGCAFTARALLRRASLTANIIRPNTRRATWPRKTLLSVLAAAAHAILSTALARSASASERAHRLPEPRDCLRLDFARRAGSGQPPRSGVSNAWSEGTLRGALGIVLLLRSAPSQLAAPAALAGKLCAKPDLTRDSASALGGQVGGAGEVVARLTIDQRARERLVRDHALENWRELLCPPAQRHVAGLR